ncbi:MAG: DUF4465 domain-containing protein [Planctomycetota bacterium]
MVMMLVAVGMTMVAGVARAEVIADFNDLSLDPESYWRGSETADGFVSGGAWFNTTYTYFADWDWVSWDGFAYSNVSDTTTAGYTNQFAAITGTDLSGSGNYAVGYDAGAEPPHLSILDAGDGVVLDGAYVTNTTYAYLSMRDGDAFAKQFGGPTGDDPDWFALTVTGLHADGSTNTLDVDLADFRFADNAADYILDEWTWVDLSGLGPVVGLAFTLSSSDMGPDGMNTPAYFALDGLAVPEPTTLLLMAAGLLGLRRQPTRRRFKPLASSL